MQIPTMRSVIDTFGGCTPALEWASDMDVQRGWEVCTEPGWLMLLAFQTQNHPNAVGFAKSALCTYECIKPAMQFTSDPLLHDILNRAYYYSQDLAEFKIVGMKANQTYLMKSIKAKMIEIAVEDDGPGFSPEVLDWLGEPYLSTRSEEGGLGLGIFIAITLLARSGATLHVHNNIRGACVTVTWPPNALERASEETSHERRGR